MSFLVFACFSMLSLVLSMMSRMASCVDKAHRCGIISFPLSEFVPCIVRDGLEGWIEFRGAAKNVDCFEASPIVVEDHRGDGDCFP